MAIDNFLASIEKRLGKGIVITKKVDIETVPSGSIVFDQILGGGFAKGRIHEIYGPPSSGKSTAALHLCKSIQESGKTVFYVDTEQSLDLEYAKKIGVSLENDKFLLSQPDTAESALEAVRMGLEETEIGLVVLDSVAGLVPQCVIQGEVGDAKIGLIARLMSVQLGILKNICNKNNNILLCINQIRQKINGFGFGPTTTTPGGEALKFYSTQRVEFNRIGTDKDGEVAVANKTKIKIVKNKIAPPLKTCEVMLRFGVGFDTIQEAVEMAVDLGICKKKGAWFYYGDDYRLGQGIANVREILEGDIELFNEIREQVKQSLCNRED